MENPLIDYKVRAFAEYLGCDPKLAQEMAAKLNERGVYVTAFSFPVVPKGQDRIRTQMSAALTREMLDRAIDAFEAVGRELGVIR